MTGSHQATDGPLPLSDLLGAFPVALLAPPT